MVALHGYIDSESVRSVPGGTVGPRSDGWVGSDGWPLLSRSSLLRADLPEPPPSGHDAAPAAPESLAAPRPVSLRTLTPDLPWLTCAGLTPEVTEESARTPGNSGDSHGGPKGSHLLREGPHLCGGAGRPRRARRRTLGAAWLRKS